MVSYFSNRSWRTWLIAIHVFRFFYYRYLFLLTIPNSGLEDIFTCQHWWNYKTYFDFIMNSRIEISFPFQMYSYLFIRFHIVINTIFSGEGSIIFITTKIMFYQIAYINCYRLLLFALLKLQSIIIFILVLSGVLR